MKKSIICFCSMVAFMAVASTFALAQSYGYGDDYRGSRKRSSDRPYGFGEDYTLSPEQSLGRSGKEIPSVPEGSESSYSPGGGGAKELALTLLAMPARALNGVLTIVEDWIGNPAIAGNFEMVRDFISMAARPVGFAFYGLSLCILIWRIRISREEDEE